MTTYTYYAHPKQTRGGPDHEIIVTSGDELLGALRVLGVTDESHHVWRVKHPEDPKRLTVTKADVQDT